MMPTTIKTLPNPFLPHTVENANIHKYLYLLLRTKAIVPVQCDQEEFPENSRAAENETCSF